MKKTKQKLEEENRNLKGDIIFFIILLIIITSILIYVETKTYKITNNYCKATYGEQAKQINWQGKQLTCQLQKITNKTNIIDEKENIRLIK